MGDLPKYEPGKGGVVYGPCVALIGNEVIDWPEHVLTLEDIERAVQGMMEPKPVSLFVPPHKLDEVIAEATRTGMSTDNIKPSMPLHMVKTEGD